MIDPLTYRVISQTSEDHRPAVRVPEHTETSGQQLWADARSHKDPTKVFKSCELRVLMCVYESVWIWTETQKKLCPEEQSFYFPFNSFWFHFVGGCRGQAATY